MNAVDGPEFTTAKVMAVRGAPAEVATLRDAAVAASTDLAGFTPDGLRFGLVKEMREAQPGLPSLVSTLDSFRPPPERSARCSGVTGRPTGW